MNEKLRAAAQAALETLDILSKLGNGDVDGNSKGNEIAQDARQNLRAALAEPAIKDSLIAQRPWVGLTDGEILEMFGVVGTSGSDINPRGLLKDTRRIETKLKEKNGG